ncbi:MAG TPA: hypothetical protein VMF12_19145 [Xanthobacteraceae bacterium]|nr:hypothetical protein [Xanthobacteraceae bacterium]
MWMPGRFIMAGFAVFVLWTLVRAWRTGIIRDGIWLFDSDDKPFMYALAFASHSFIVVLFAAGAAGYPPSEVFDFVGLGWLNSFFLAMRHA